MHIITKLGFATALDWKSHYRGTQIFFYIITNLCLHFITNRFSHYNKSVFTLSHLISNYNIFLNIATNICQVSSNGPT